MGLVGAATGAATPAREPLPLAWAWALAGGADVAAILVSPPGQEWKVAPPTRLGFAWLEGAGEAAPGGDRKEAGGRQLETGRRRRRRRRRRQGPEWNLGAWPGAGGIYMLE